VLVVDDDAMVADVVVAYLEQAGYAVEAVGDGRTAIDRALAEPPDLIILDLMLPGFDGLEVCRRIRALAPVPIIMLTARVQTGDRVTGLELGADDYVTKPFSPRELVSRVRAVLRRSGDHGDGDLDNVLEAGDIVVDVAARAVSVRGVPVATTARELELLVYLMRHPGRVLRREELLEAVWGSVIGDTSTVTVHVRRLREKVELDPATPRHLVTVWGVGYRFDP
jgi:DNA-binding response OmpR family regulator